VKPVCLPILPGITAAVGYFARSAVSRAPRSSGFRPNGRHLRSFSAAREEPRPGQEERFLAVVPGLRPCYDLNSVSIRVPAGGPAGNPRDHHTRMEHVVKMARPICRRQEARQHESCYLRRRSQRWKTAAKSNPFLPIVRISFERSLNSATVFAGGDARVLHGPSSSHKFTNASASASITIADRLAGGGDIQDGKGRPGRGRPGTRNEEEMKW
jgi:hypothetical protein